MAGVVGMPDNAVHPLQAPFALDSLVVSSEELVMCLAVFTSFCSAIWSTAEQLFAVPQCNAIGKDALDGAAIKVLKNLKRQMDLPKFPQKKRRW